jgi:hypothetical protein
MIRPCLRGLKQEEFSFPSGSVANVLFQSFSY